MSEKEIQENQEELKNKPAEELAESGVQSEAADESANSESAEKAQEEKQEGKEERKDAGEASESASADIEKGDKKNEQARGRRPRRQLKGKKKAFTRRKREERKSEFEQKIISLRRVTRVVAGGRRFSFSVAMVLGDKKGRVGVGIGKSSDTAMAIDKAIRDAKANMIKVNRTEEGGIPFDCKAKYGSSEVEIRPAPGRGLVAGASVRVVLDLAGVSDVTSKIWTRSKNQINIARATVEALKMLDD